MESSHTCFINTIFLSSSILHPKASPATSTLSVYSLVVRTPSRIASISLSCGVSRSGIHLAKSMLFCSVCCCWLWQESLFPSAVVSSCLDFFSGTNARGSARKTGRFFILFGDDFWDCWICWGCSRFGSLTFVIYLG